MATDKGLYKAYEQKQKDIERSGWYPHHVCRCGYVASNSENGVLMIYTFPWCPKCEMRHYQRKYRRWISTSVWSKPSTWFSGYYEWKDNL